MSESTLLRNNQNIKRFTLVDSQGNSLTDDTFDAINAVAPKSSIITTPAQTAVGTAEGQILASNSSRKRLMVQNTGTTVVKLAFGNAPTQTAYHVALLAGTAADDGTGGSYLDEVWTGTVRAISSAAGGTCVVSEYT